MKTQQRKPKMVEKLVEFHFYHIFTSLSRKFISGERGEIIFREIEVKMGYKWNSTNFLFLLLFPLRSRPGIFFRLSFPALFFCHFFSGHPGPIPFKCFQAGSFVYSFIFKMASKFNLHLATYDQHPIFWLPSIQQVLCSWVRSHIIIVWCVLSEHTCQ